MKKTIKNLVIICVMCFALGLIMSSCRKPMKRVYFGFPASLGIIDIPIGAETDKGLDSIVVSGKTVFTEDDAPREIMIDDIFPELHSDNPLCYKESSFSDDIGTWRSYKYMTETGQGSYAFFPDQNKLYYFDEHPYEAAIKEEYMKLSKADLLSKEQCLEKAKAFLAVLYSNTESFAQYDKWSDKLELDGLEADCICYNFLFKREVEGVTICSVEITVRNDGEISSVLNGDCITNDRYDKASNLDLKAALKEADDAVNEKVKSFGDDYSAKYNKALLIPGTENRLVLLVQYELWQGDFSGSVVLVYVVL